MATGRKKSRAESAFECVWRFRGAPGVEMHPEFIFHPTRRWRFDYAFPAAKLAVEIDGRGRDGHPGRHHSITGASKDYAKLNAAAVLGWLWAAALAVPEHILSIWDLETHGIEGDDKVGVLLAAIREVQALEER